MSEVEFLSVAASIVLALALGKLISSLPYVMDKSRFDWVHLLFVNWALLGGLMQWWRTWDLHAHELWSFGDFLLVMIPAITFYLSVHVLTSEAPREVASWRAHFSNRYRWFFVATLITLIFSMARQSVLGDGVPNLTGLVLGIALIAGAVANNRIVHSVIGVVMNAIMVVSISTAWY